ncbi:MAG TPA: alpha/beta hydrolase [Pseudonocardiaceae bacterium]|nr:alpha/beta hydrolase [Pseudonocardiaceae bacterium]
MHEEQDELTGGSGVRLAVRSAGAVDAPPIVLLHGWAQSGAAFAHQLAGPLAERFRLVAPDLRGHGDSAVPADGYDSSAEWAADVRAVLDCAGRPAVLLGWSYGGLVVTDYLREFGTADLAGIVLVGAATELGRGHPGGRVGPAMRAALPAALSEDEQVAGAALAAFVTGMAGTAHAGLASRPNSVTEALVEEALRVPAFVRAALFRREVTSADVLAKIDVPTLIVQGSADAVVEPSAARFAEETIPGARLHLMTGVGHLPFLERTAEFDALLGSFADECFAAQRNAQRSAQPNAQPNAQRNAQHSAGHRAGGVR